MEPGKWSPRHKWQSGEAYGPTLLASEGSTACITAKALARSVVMTRSVDALDRFEPFGADYSSSPAVLRFSRAVA